VYEEVPPIAPVSSVVLVMRFFLFAVLVSVVCAGDPIGEIKPILSWTMKLRRVLEKVGNTKPSRDTLYEILDILDAAKGSTEAPIDSEFSEYLEESKTDPFRILHLMEGMLPYTSNYD
jgi:hypothetical protein